ncbi:MAG: response regulator, partial [Polyangia bacterium]
MAGILIVEPPSPARDELERALGIAGHRVLVVGDGQSALETWRTERQDLAILDEAATHVNGLGVALRMKAESPSSFMPVMIVTARDAVARAAALAIADDVVTRPFDVREVVARVTALLRTRSIVDELR